MEHNINKENYVWGETSGRIFVNNKDSQRSDKGNERWGRWLIITSQTMRKN